MDADRWYSRHTGCTTFSLYCAAFLAILGGSHYGTGQLTGPAPSSVVVEVALPGVKPDREDYYVCTTVRVRDPGYIVKFIPKASGDRVHHMLLFGCPGAAPADGSVWECMNHPSCSNAFARPSILYAWARNAPGLELPPGVAVPIANADSAIDYYLLQVHYSQKFVGDVVDHTGVDLEISNQRPQYFAGVSLFASSYGFIGPHQRYVQNISCTMNIPKPVYAFAYRTHAHSLGRVISGAVWHAQQKEWELAGKSNPQWPQRFYHADKPVKIDPGDTVAAQCIFQSNRNAMTTFGPYSSNEMCNFYIYYYSTTPVNVGACSTVGSKAVFDRYPAEYSAEMAPNPVLEDQAKPIEIPFGVISNKHWLASGVTLGQISGLALDANHNLLIFHRGPRVWDQSSFDAFNRFRPQTPIDVPTVVVADSQSGKILSQWGANFFYLPHDIFVDSQNNIWFTDVGSHQVFKFPPDGGSTPLLTLGEKFIPGNDAGHFCKPAGVVVSQVDGSVYIADGYCNQRVVKFTANGVYVQSWGHANSNGALSPLGSLNVAHGLSLNEQRNIIYVADRENGRVQVLSLSNGTFFDQIGSASFGGNLLFGVKYSPELNLFFALTGPGGRSPSRYRVYAFDGTHHSASYSFAPENDRLVYPHTLAVNAQSRSIFVGEIGPNVLWKFDISGPTRKAREVDPVQMSMANVDDDTDSATTIGREIFLACTLFGFCAFAIVAVLFLLRRQARDVIKRHGFDFEDPSATSAIPLYQRWLHRRRGFRPLNTYETDATNDEVPF